MLGRSVNLADDEEIQHSFRPKWAAWFGLIVMTIGLGLPIAWWQRRKTKYIITNRRVIQKRSTLVSSRSDEFRLADVQRIRTSKSMGERILGGGTIELDTGVDEITLKAVPNHSTVVSTLREEYTD